MIKKVIFPIITAGAFLLPLLVFAANNSAVWNGPGNNSYSISPPLSASTLYYIYCPNPTNYDGTNIGSTPETLSYANDGSGWLAASPAGLDNYTFTTSGSPNSSNFSMANPGMALNVMCSSSFVISNNYYFPPLAPINNISSTINLSGMVYTEIVSLPIYELQHYETPLVGIAIIFALFFGIFAILKIFNIL